MLSWNDFKSWLGNGLSSLGNSISPNRPDILGASYFGVRFDYDPTTQVFNGGSNVNSLNINNAPDNLMLSLKDGSTMSLGKYKSKYGIDSSNSNFFGKGLSGLDTLAGIGLGIGNYFQNQRALENMEDMYDFQKRLASVNLANQAKMINNRYKTSALASVGLQGASDSQGRITTPSQDAVNAAEKRAESRYVRSYI